MDPSRQKRKQTGPLLGRRLPLRSNQLTAVMLAAAGFGVVVLVIAFAAGNYGVFEVENGTVAGGAKVVSAAGASGGQAVEFGAPSPTPTPTPTTTPTPVPTPSGSCTAAANTPSGPDPWGGCWPGPSNTGVPTGTHLVNVDTGTVNPPNASLPSDNTGWSYSSANGYISVYSQNAVIDGVSDVDGVYVAAAGSLTIKNSQVGTINDEGTSLLVENSALNGGNQWTFSTISGGTNITVKNSNLSGGEHEVHCYGNCDVENSYLHDNANGAAAGAHQNGFLSNSGSTYTLKHNSVGCVGGCTADIAFLNNDSQSDATVTNNLLLYSPDASYCAYPGPNASPTANPVSNMVWENNVFQKGANGKCATYGPVYGWFPSVGPGNVWSGNTWSDGSALNQ